MTEPERILLSEACRITGLCQRTLQSLAANGQVWGAAKLGGRWTFDRLRLRAWIKANEERAAGRRTYSSVAASGTRALRSTIANIDDRLKRGIDAKLSAGSRHG